jgi:putative ABC transport system permease protein
MFWQVAWHSLAQRKASVLLTVAALTVSVLVLVGIEQLRQNARTGFARTVAGTDLIVGARTGDINLLLYAVFRLGNASNNIAWRSYEEIAALSDVAWTIPLSLGDSHRGYKVLATNADYFAHFRYGSAQPLVLAQGKPFEGLLEVVLGAEVARRLGYQVGDKVVLAHGAASTSFTLHDAHPFQVVGIFAPTGTPVDQTLHISLESMEAIHHPGHQGHGNDLAQLQPRSITAVMVGLQSRIKVFQVQRQINGYRGEPLQAILPGVTLTQLWSTLAIMENTLRAISALVLVAALFGMAAMLLASLRERRREILLLRTLGASPLFIGALLQLEGLVMAGLAVVFALGIGSAGLALGAEFWLGKLGLQISANLFHAATAKLVLYVFGGALVVGALPALSAYRISRLVSYGL